MWRVLPAFLFFLQFVSFDTRGYGAEQAILLRDITKDLANYLVLRAILPTLAEAQIAVTDHFLRNYPIMDTEAAQMRRFRTYAEAVLKDPVHSSSQQFEQAIFLPSIHLWLYDPRSLANKTANLSKKIRATDCKNVQLLHNSRHTERELEVHNFFVFYLRNVQRICGTPVEWHPKSAIGIIQTLFEIFSGEEYFKALHEYLEDFGNRPFKRTGEFFTVMYFQYLRLAFKARYVNMALRELLGGRPDLKQRFPEIGGLQNLLYLKVTAGLSD